MAPHPTPRRKATKFTRQPFGGLTRRVAGGNLNRHVYFQAMGKRPFAPLRVTLALLDILRSKELLGAAGGYEQPLIPRRIVGVHELPRAVQPLAMKPKA